MEPVVPVPYSVMPVPNTMVAMMADAMVAVTVTPAVASSSPSHSNNKTINLNPYQCDLY